MARALPKFWVTDNPISTRVTDYAHVPQYYGPCLAQIRRGTLGISSDSTDGFIYVLHLLSNYLLACILGL